MNENIRKLAEQSGICMTDLGGTFNVKNFSIFTKDSNLEKFAELIVRDCTEICDQVQGQYGQYTFTATKVKDRIKQHFGVEE